MEDAEPKGFSPSTLKFLVRHMTGSARLQREREEKISGFESQITMLKKTALSKKPSAEKIDAGFEDLENSIKELISDERTIVLNQAKEEKIIEELKERLDLLEEKVYGLGHVHSMTSQEHIRRIDEMNKRLSMMSGAAVSAGEKRKAKHHPELVIKTMKYLGSRKKGKELVIKTMKTLGRKKEGAKLKEMLNDAERRYNELKKKGTSKSHLATLKKIIDSYRKRVKSVKD